jgi:hypothetical protein
MRSSIIKLPTGGTKLRTTAGSEFGLLMIGTIRSQGRIRKSTSVYE